MGRRCVALVPVAALLIVALSSCGEDEQPTAPDDFCDAAVALEDGLERQVGLDEQIRLVERLAETAPAEIRAEAEVFLDALRRVETDPSVVDDDEIKAAVDEVNRYATNGCELFEREGGGSPF